MSEKYLYQDVPYSAEVLLALRERLRIEFLDAGLIRRITNNIQRKRNGVFHLTMLDTDRLVEMLKGEYPNETRRMILWLMLGAEMTVRRDQADKPRWRNTKVTLGKKPLQKELAKEITEKLRPYKVYAKFSYTSARLLGTFLINFGEMAERMRSTRSSSEEEEVETPAVVEIPAEIHFANSVGHALKEDLQRIVAGCEKDGLVKESESVALVSKLINVFAIALVG